MSVAQIRQAFSGLRDMGYTSDTQVLRMCGKAYQRQPNTRIKLALRLAINRAIERAEPGDTLNVRDQDGEIYVLFATMRSLNGLTARLRIEKPEAYLRLAETPPKQASFVLDDAA